jgi:hypothetical protein
MGLCVNWKNYDVPENYRTASNRPQ